MTIHSAADRAERTDKRERILAAAERVFARRGFFAARVSEIAKDAGVADGTIYLYFKSKDDLLISLFEARMKQVNAVLREAIAGAPPQGQLRAFIRAYLRLVHDEPGAAEVLTIELRQSSKFMKEYENPQFADFLRIRGGAGARRARSLDPEPRRRAHDLRHARRAVARVGARPAADLGALAWCAPEEVRYRARRRLGRGPRHLRTRPQT
jgi:AcrR family transcriptional regulator